MCWRSRTGGRRRGRTSPRRGRPRYGCLAGQAHVPRGSVAAAPPARRPDQAARSPGRVGQGLQHPDGSSSGRCAQPVGGGHHELSRGQVQRAQPPAEYLPPDQRRMMQPETRAHQRPAVRTGRPAHSYRTGRLTRPGHRVSHAASLPPPARRGSCAYRITGYPVLSAGLTIGPPVVCSSGRRRLPSAVPVTETRRLRLAVQGPVEQLGVLATLSRWRSRVQIPSGPQGSPVRLHWGSQPGQVAQLV
jgi:hypothetical protein